MYTICSNNVKEETNFFHMGKILEKNKMDCYCSFTFLFSKFSLGTYYVCWGGKQTY